MKTNEGLVTVPRHEARLLILWFKKPLKGDISIMLPPSTQLPLSSIILDETIYPRKSIDPRRVGIFAENIRDGFEFDPVEVEPCPDRPGFYRLLDGAHRWSAFKATGAETVFVIVRDLAGEDPLLYAAAKAIGRIPAPLSSRRFSPGV
jgi:hypothetical protein